MLLRFPRALGLPERGEQVAALDFPPYQIREEGASAALAHQPVHLGEEICGQNDVSAFAEHIQNLSHFIMCYFSVWIESRRGTGNATRTNGRFCRSRAQREGPGRPRAGEP